MRIMDDMEPILSLLKSSFEEIQDIFEYYFEETGGLEKRLKILKKIAYNLYSIHSRGIVYGDISANNIFISKDKNNAETWFIDCDNMDYYYDMSIAIGTEGFTSPELMKYLNKITTKKCINTIESDIYAFARLFVYMIFLCDPFKGSISQGEDSSGSGWDSTEEEWGSSDQESSDQFTLDEKIEYGMVSWIGENDLENKPIFGLSPFMDKIISLELKELLNKTLNFEGRNNPKSRPSMRLWYEEINNLLNSLVTFECGHVGYVQNKKCLVCNSEPKKYLLIDIDLGLNKKNKRILKSIEKENFIFNITYGELGIGVFNKAEEICLEFEKNYSKYLVKNKFDSEIKLIYKDRVDGEVDIVLKSKKRDQVSSFIDLKIEVPKNNVKVRISG